MISICEVDLPHQPKVLRGKPLETFRFALQVRRQPLDDRFPPAVLFLSHRNQAANLEIEGDECLIHPSRHLGLGTFHTSQDFIQRPSSCATLQRRLAREADRGLSGLCLYYGIYLRTTLGFLPRHESWPSQVR